MFVQGSTSVLSLKESCEKKGERVLKSLKAKLQMISCLGLDIQSKRMRLA